MVIIWDSIWDYGKFRFVLEPAFIYRISEVHGGFIMDITVLKTVILLWMKNKRQTVKDSTFDKYSEIADRFFFALKDAKIGIITGSTVHTYIENLQQILSPVSVKNIITVIKEILVFASENQLIDKACNYTFPKISATTSEPRNLTSAESMKLNYALIESGKISDICILIALNMGLRIGEICALRWENIDFSRKSISITCTAIRIRSDSSNGRNKTKLAINTPKTLSSKREVPVPDFILKLLKSQKPEDCRAFILSGKSDRIPEPRNLQRTFRTKCKKILGYSINFHALRHTFATLSISNGTDPKTVSKLLGHSSVTTTLNLYRSVSFDDKTNAISALEKVIGPKKKVIKKRKNNTDN